jgi:hypothetical protein
MNNKYNYTRTFTLTETTVGRGWDKNYKLAINCAAAWERTKIIFVLLRCCVCVRERRDGGFGGV